MDSSDYAAAIAANVAKTMAVKGCSLLRLAQETNIPRTTLTRRLTSDGASPFSVSELYDVASALGCEAHSFYPRPRNLAA